MINHVSKPLEEFAPRKAKYAFRGRVAPETMLALAECLHRGLSIDPDMHVETNFNMGANEFKIYTDDAAVAIAVREFVR